jgi:hypothetical protein
MLLLLQVKQLLSAAKDIDAIIQAVPELIDPATLSRSLAFLASSFRGQVRMTAVVWGFSETRFCFLEASASLACIATLSRSLAFLRSSFRGQVRITTVVRGGYILLQISWKLGYDQPA